MWLAKLVGTGTTESSCMGWERQGLWGGAPTGSLGRVVPTPQGRGVPDIFVVVVIHPRSESIIRAPTVGVRGRGLCKSARSKHTHGRYIWRPVFVFSLKVFFGWWDPSSLQHGREIGLCFFQASNPCVALYESVLWVHPEDSTAVARAVSFEGSPLVLYLCTESGCLILLRRK